MSKRACAIIFCATSLMPTVVYSEVSVSFSTDLRGSITFLEGFYRPKSSNLSADLETSEQSDTFQEKPNSSSTSGGIIEQFDILPTLSVNYSYKQYGNHDWGVGFLGAFSYVNIKARYPNGFTLSSSGRNITFAEAASFTLRSLDFGFGPYLSWHPSKKIHANVSVLFLHQRLELSSTLGSWNLSDQFQRSFVEWASSVEYILFNSLTYDRFRPSIFLAITGRPGEKIGSIGMKLSF